MSSNAFWICAPAVTLFMLLPVAGCSIKEDRDPCPCCLTIRDGSGTAVDDDVFWFVDAVGFEQCGVLIEEDGILQCMLGVPRGEVRLCAVSGAGECLGPGGSVTIPLGEQCPPVYRYQAWLNTRRDSLTDTIRLHKNYALVRLHGYDAGALRHELSGDICGCGCDVIPVKGPFRAVCNEDSGFLSCRVPRQVDDSLKLDLYKGDTLARSFPIGEYIRESGYDWQNEDLEDIDISLDFTTTGAIIRVNGWVRTLTFYIDF